MKYFLFAASLLFTLDVSLGQNLTDRDGLQQKRIEIDSLNSSALDAYGESDYVEARQFSEKAVEKAEIIHYARGVEVGSLVLAEIFYDLKNLDLSITYFQSVLALKEARGDRQGVAYCLNNMGLLYGKMNNYEEAMKYHFLSLKVADEINDLERIASATNNIGNMYDTLENYSRAMEYHLRSLECGQALGDREGVAKTYGNLGVIFRKQGEFEKALEYYHKAVVVYERENNASGKATILNNISNAYMSMNQLNKALTYGEQALSIAEGLHDEDLKAYTLSSIGDILFKKNELERSLGFQKSALKKTTDNELLKHIYKNIILIFGELNDDVSLIRYHKLYMEAENRIITARANKKVRGILINYESERKQKEQELLEKNREIEKLILYLQVAGYLMLIFFIFHIHSLYRNKVKLAKKLDMISRIDPLTGLPNRRDMLERVENELCRYERTKRPFTLMISDIDDFKKINDTYGHETGDRVLKEVTRKMRETIRKQDVVCRWGGEEFLFMLPDTHLEGGILIAEKVRNIISEHAYLTGDVELKVHVTTGVSEYQEGMGLHYCIRRADDALYRGKESGKNKVVAWKENEDFIEPG